MYLYIFLSVIIICITFIICFVLNNFTEISDYYKYKNDHFELKRLRDEYNENITKYQIQVENICNIIKDIKVCDSDFIKNNNEIIRTLFSINSILHDDLDTNKKLEDIDKVINNFKS